MLRLLIDTCVWLELAKDYRLNPLLTALENLVKNGEVSLIIPRLVIDEFARNKERVVRESGQSVSSLVRRAKKTVDQFGKDDTKAATLAALADIDHRIATMGEAVNDSIAQVEALFAASHVEETTDELKIKAATRAIDKRAPFHKSKNSIDDAILIETFADVIAAERGPGCTFAFVTDNHHDFSGTDRRHPHPDIQDIFKGEDATFSVNLQEVLTGHAPDWFVDFPDVDLEAFEEPKRLSEILTAIDEFHDKVWYNRHWGLRNDVESGRIKIIEKVDWKLGQRYPQDVVVRETWESALKAAERVEAKYPDDLGPWNDFEWGMINGKLSALRWMLGDKWDMLDT